METSLILYHGSNHDFDEVDLSKSKDKRDFGKSFYTTTLCEQAEDWAEVLKEISKMKGKYIFKDQDITTDILFKIEQVSSILAKRKRISFDDAYDNFISSDTYAIMKRTDNLYWAESAEFLADEYYREKNSCP